MKKEPRIDRDALRAQWPQLYASTPDASKFEHREATLTMVLAAADVDQLHELARQFGTSAAGMVLLTVFTFLYGRYPMAATRRAQSGLFKGFSAGDPAPFSTLKPDSNGMVGLSIPQRMHDDLAAFARRRATTVPALAGAIVRAFLHGHPDLVVEGELPRER